MADMSVEERTLKVREACIEQFARLPVYLAERLADAIAAAIIEAMEAERAAIKDTAQELIDRGVVHESADIIIDAIEARAITICNHEWVDIRNKIIQSGEMCIKCRALRAGNAPVKEN